MSELLELARAQSRRAVVDDRLVEMLDGLDIPAARQGDLAPLAYHRPPSASISQNEPRYVRGERVRHRRFGPGRIIGLTGRGKDLKVTVVFEDEDHGTKQLVGAYAGLEQADDGPPFTPVS